jgi:hypothetical protein
VQAGLRTDYLVRAVNQWGGTMLGAGVLSELALGGGSGIRPRHRDHPGAGSDRRGRTGAEQRGQSRSVRAAGLHPLPRPALPVQPSKIAFLAWHAWHASESGRWPPGFPADQRFGYELSEIRHWLEVSCGDSSRSASSSAQLSSTVPRYPRAGRCLPAVTGAHPRIWRRRSGCGGGNGSAAVGVERYARRHQPEGMTPTGRVFPRYG